MYFLVFKPNHLLIMKKVLFALVLVMAVIAVNAQDTKATTKEMGTRTTIMVGDLQKAITDNIAKDYAGYTVKEAASVNTAGVITYEVTVVKDMMTETLVYDKDGKFLKKLPAATEK
jgi:hypothetical protein